MPIVYPNSLAYTETIDSGNALRIKVPAGGSALVERRGPTGKVDKVTITGGQEQTFGPYQQLCSFTVSALALPCEAWEEVTDFAIAQSATDPFAGPDVQTAAPVTGSVLQMNNNRRNGLLRIQGAAPLASLNLSLPSDASSVDGQIRRVRFEVAIASLTYTPPIPNAPTSAAVNDSCTLQRLEAGKWSLML